VAAGRCGWASCSAALISDLQAFSAVCCTAAGRSPSHQAPAPAGLTPREVEVLTFVARGRSNRGIAEKLFIGEETVKTNISNILTKLHLADRTQVAIYALRRGLVPLDDE
jgi:DNA-binding NarL/FixJ family response regulator